MNHIFYKLIRFSLAIFLLAVSLAIPFGSVSATVGGATLTVNSNSDADNGSDGVCTLREAITAALNDADYHECINSGSPYANDMIVFSISGSRTITLTSNLPWLPTGTLTIDGFNSGLPITIDGANTYQPFNTNAILTLRSLTIQHGSASTGGAIDSGGTLTVINSTFLNNIATSDGGAILIGNGGATIVNSTFSANSASYGGAIAEDGGAISIYNSTLSGNTATSNGGAFSSWNTPVTAIYNTIMANSTAPEDCWQGLGGTLTGDHNIIETTGGGIQSCSSVTISTSDPNLGTLTGLPAYFPLNNSSPAIDTGNDSICAAAPVSNTSQNGLTRPQGAHCDIGAYEAPAGFVPISKWTSSFDLSHGWTVADFVRTVGDVNHDSNADLIGFGSDGVYVALSNGSSGFGPISKWSSSFDLSHGWTVADFVRTVGDVNHDGYADLIGFGSDGVYVALSNGSSSFGPISKWSSSFDLSHGWTMANYVRTVGDVNHDGNADLIGFGLDGVYVALSNGSSSFGPISKWSSSFDLSHGWTVANYVRTVGDVNHDGNADLIGFGLDGVYVALSDGSSSFGPISKWSSSFDLSHGWTVANFVRTVGDVNNDGNADLIGFGMDGVYVTLSNGSSGFGPISKWSGDFDLSHGWTVTDFVRTVGDVNHDGKADLVGFGLDGVYVATAK